LLAASRVEVFLDACVGVPGLDPGH
jgi:hypothetical protein